MGGDDQMKTLQAKPKQQQLQLEELYQGIPDESVNLTFQDLANVNSSNNTLATTKHVSEGGIINNPTNIPSPSLSTVPRLDFKKGLEASYHSHHHHDNNYNHHHQHQQHRGGGDSPWGRFSHASDGVPSRTGEYSMSYNGMKSGESFASGKGGSGRRRRPGIPHSKICTICSNYVYLFRTRCLVCLCALLVSYSGSWKMKKINFFIDKYYFIRILVLLIKEIQLVIFSLFLYLCIISPILYLPKMKRLIILFSLIYID